jgi:hypothetical protein
MLRLTTMSREHRADMPLKLQIAQRKALDEAVVTFLEKSAGDISKVFLGDKEAFQTLISNGKIFVGRGYVTIDHFVVGFLFTRYMPAE